MSRLPFRPESLESLQARYPRAIDHKHDVAPILAGTAAAPSTDPAHVFDFRDGTRLAVSIEVLEDGRDFTHFSASLDDSSGLVAQIKTGKFSLDEWLELCVAHYREISDDDTEIVFLGFSEGKGIPHWSIEPEPEPGGHR